MARVWWLFAAIHAVAELPSIAPTTVKPTDFPSKAPSNAPSRTPSRAPSMAPTTSPTASCDPSYSFSFTGTLPPSRTNFTRVLMQPGVRDHGLLCDLSGDKSVYAVLVDDQGVVGQVLHSSYFCPVLNRSSISPLEYGVTFGGMAGANFSFRCCFQEVDLRVAQYEPKVFTATSDRVFIFFFDVNRREIDVTTNPLAVVVESDSDSPAMLYISKEVCPTSDMLLKGSQDLPRLTFARKGRIHLSEFSNPPLTNGRWFVTVRLLSSNVQKRVTLNVQIGPEYAATNSAIWLTVFCGLAVTLFVLVFSVCVNKDNLFVSCSCFWDLTRKFLERTDPATSPSPLFSFPWFVALGLLVLSLGALQFVTSTWQLMEITGDRDKCFYNEQCYHPHNWDLPFNNILSNVIYVIAGLGFIILMSMEQCIDARHKRYRDDRVARATTAVTNAENAVQTAQAAQQAAQVAEAQAALAAEQAALATAQAAQKPSFDFSLFYALGISLVGEGLFSAIYHVCPTPINFQFDTSFMFAMCSLSILASYQQGESWGTVKAARYMLFYYGPLLWFTYIGVTSDREKTPAPGLWVAVLTWEAGLLWYIVSSFHPDAIDIDKQHEVFTGRTRCCLRHNPEGWPTCQKCTCWAGDNCCCGGVWLIILCSLVWTATLVFAILRFTDTPLFFLGMHVILSIAWGLAWGGYQIFCHPNTGMRRKASFGCSIALFIILIAIALVYFIFLGVSDKAKLPQISRASNRDCTMGFYDAHDVWHVLGGFALFFLFLSMYIINPHPEFLKDPILVEEYKDGYLALN